MTYLPPKGKDGRRVYGKWAGDPIGRREDTTRCAAQVPNPPAWSGAQCQRPRGHGANGEFCKQHAKTLPEGRQT